MSDNILISNNSGFEVRSYQERFVDPVSLQPLKNSIVLQCGHSFISTSRLVEHLKVQRECPSCKSAVRPSAPVNYYANDLYNEGLRLAQKSDRQAEKIETLQKQSSINAKTASLIEISKNQELKVKDGHISLLQEKIQEIGQDNTNLHLDNYQLQGENRILSKRIADLTIENQIQKEEIQVLKKDKEDLNKKLETITTEFNKKIETLEASEKASTNRLDALEKRKTSYSSSSSYSSHKKHHKKNECPLDALAKLAADAASTAKKSLEDCFPCLKN